MELGLPPRTTAAITRVKALERNSGALRHTRVMSDIKAAAMTVAHNLSDVGTLGNVLCIGGEAMKTTGLQLISDVRGTTQRK